MVQPEPTDVDELLDTHEDETGHGVGWKREPDGTITAYCLDCDWERRGLRG